MIALLTGTVIAKTSTETIIDCNGVGYQVFTSVNTSEHIAEAGNKVKIFTLLIPKEDAIQLYGFWCESERDAFKMLISISGVGPKIALAVLSSLTVDDLQKYIISGNIHALQKLPGIGKKTAERIVLELKDKVIKLETESAGDGTISVNLIAQEALSALITLGYSRLIAEKAVKSAIGEIKNDEMTAEIIIKTALKFALI